MQISYEKRKIVRIALIVIAVVGCFFELYAIIFDLDKSKQIIAVIVSLAGIIASGGTYIINLNINVGKIDSPDIDLNGVVINNYTGSVTDKTSHTMEGRPSDELTDYVVKNREDVFYYNQAFFVDMKVRNVTRGNTDFSYSAKADIGDELEYQIEYINSSDAKMKNVIAKTWLPRNGVYINGTTKLFNEKYPDGAIFDDDTIGDVGVNIGNYEVGANAFVRYRLRISDLNLEKGRTQVYTWIGVQSKSSGIMLKHADAYVDKR